MYETPKKMDLRKKIELGVLLFLIFWGILFIINYVRFSNSKPLILAISAKHEYEDGIVQEYISLGYIYRNYQRSSISREEFVPFWVLRENPEPEPDLPKALTDYEVPENVKKDDKYMGLLYYYNSKRKLVGTYKCINSVMDCDKAVGGYDSFNLLGDDPFGDDETIMLGQIHEKYAFVDDSVAQEVLYGEVGYNRTIYLYNFLTQEREILAKFADVKVSTVSRGLGYGVNNDYILKSADNNKWGLMHIYENGNVEEVLPYEYQSIEYDEDTGYYILCKDNVWFIYDLENKKVVSAESVDPIYDVWRNDNLTYYFRTGRKRSDAADTIVDYKIFRIDGKQFLGTEQVTYVLARSNYVMYLTENNSLLHFVDYSGEEKESIQLVFADLRYDDFSHPAFEINRESDKYITIKIWSGRQIGDSYRTQTVGTANW